ncbi:MAG: CerR family C-terminal domain-containing protein [Planctomycetota bacterium]|nr:CerR family C-terminal domain-containing protein [Planctomycetota bacterium]
MSDVAGQSGAGKPVEEGTRERLIQAAGEEFACRGFRDATVRDICARAGANLAAVNYHFGDKDGLYQAVMRYSHELARERYPVQLAADADASARLRQFVRGMMSRLLDDGRPSWHGKLMSREMVEPTPALALVVEEAIGPMYLLLSSIVAELLGNAGRDVNRVRLMANSIIGQCLMYKHCQPVLKLLERPSQRRDSIDELAEHIAAFSLAAIAGLKNDAGKIGKERA